MLSTRHVAALRSNAAPPRERLRESPFFQRAASHRSLRHRRWDRSFGRECLCGNMASRCSGAAVESCGRRLGSPGAPNLPAAAASWRKTREPRPASRPDAGSRSARTHPPSPCSRPGPSSESSHARHRRSEPRGRGRYVISRTQPSRPARSGSARRALAERDTPGRSRRNWRTGGASVRADRPSARECAAL